MIDQDLTKSVRSFVRSIRKPDHGLLSFCIFLLLSLKTIFSFALDFKQSSSIEHQLLLNNIFTTETRSFLIAEKLIRLSAFDLLNSNENPLEYYISISYVSWLKQSHYFIGLKERLNFYSKSGLKSHYANLLEMAALTAYSNGEYNLTQHYLKNSLNINSRLANHAEVADLAEGLASLYFITNDYDLAIKYNQLVIKESQFLKETKGLLQKLFLNSDLYLATCRYKKAEDLILKRVLLACYNTNNKDGEALCYYHLGKSYLGQKKFTESKWFFIQSNTLYKKLNQKRGVIKTLLMLSKTKNRINDYQLALKDILIAKALINKQNEIFEIDIARQLVETYKLTGNTEKAQLQQDIYINKQKKYVINL